MRRINVTYHHEGAQWWAESPEVAGFTAVAESLDELRALTVDGLTFYLEGEHFQLVEQTDGHFMSGSLSALSGWNAWFVQHVASGFPISAEHAPSSKQPQRELNPVR